MPHPLLLRALAALLLGLLALPVVAVAVGGLGGGLSTALTDPRVLPALLLSLRTSALAVTIVVTLGTPLALLLARARGVGARMASALVDLPVVVPPAVLGVGLLLAFGPHGPLGALGLALPFTEGAVVLAQVVVAAPFYVQAAATAFRGIDPELLVVAQTLGATPTAAWARVGLPLAAPGLLAGASLAWARALGEFGATLLFAGNLPGTTQTLPLAVFSAMEGRLDVALALSLVLLALGLLALLAVRAVPVDLP